MSAYNAHLPGFGQTMEQHRFDGASGMTLLSIILAEVYSRPDASATLNELKCSAAICDEEVVDNILSLYELCTARGAGNYDWHDAVRSAQHVVPLLVRNLPYDPEVHRLILNNPNFHVELTDANTFNISTPSTLRTPRTTGRTVQTRGVSLRTSHCQPRPGQLPGFAPGNRRVALSRNGA